ncbi:MAG: hypothetical protein HXS48_14815 [Theionarchaea archaeon]|nr:hypothetical protein [Theionarchaea archaeon]
MDAIDLSSFFGDDRDNVSFVQCLMSELDQCIHEQFNMAVALRVLHNTPPQYHQICIDQVANILDKRGCLIMSVASWNDFARIHLDHPLGSRDNRHEYLTGLKFGFSLYRYYFKYSEIRSLVEERFEILLVDEITSPSGISNHPPRKYWIVLARKL